MTSKSKESRGYFKLEGKELSAKALYNVTEAINNIWGFTERVEGLSACGCPKCKEELRIYAPLINSLGLLATAVELADTVLDSESDEITIRKQVIHYDELKTKEDLEDHFRSHGIDPTKLH